MHRARRALEAPVEDLIDAGVITSGDVLARVLPQATAQHMSSDVPDAALAALHSRTYAAFRRRRGLLLLNLEHQVRFEELPWVAALQPLRRSEDAGVRATRRAVESIAYLVLTTWPDRILPNPLVREIGNLTGQAGLCLPLVEEVAADIFMGTFTQKWRQAACIASEQLAGTVYGRYYDLPAPQTWLADDRPRRLRASIKRGNRTAEDFSQLCRDRSAEAGADTRRSVASNGAVLEQSQILTTHNLAALCTGLDLVPGLSRRAGTLAERALLAALRLLADPPPQHHARLITVKNAAYAWRQGLFFLSLCADGEQAAVINRVRQHANGRPCQPGSAVVKGLLHVAEGGLFSATGKAPGDGRRLLGWSVGPHWALDAHSERDPVGGTPSH